MVKILYGKSSYSEAYERYVICEKFGWDYYTYEKQPSRFIEEIVMIMNQEAKKQQQESNKQQRASKLTPGRAVRRRK